MLLVYLDNSLNIQALLVCPAMSGPRLVCPSLSCPAISVNPRNHVRSSKDALNSSVFSWRRNAKYVYDVLTDECNAFQARAAATGKTRSPRVARRVDGTSSVDVDPDLRRRRDLT